jgi:hypothetical protein
MLGRHVFDGQVEDGRCSSRVASEVMFVVVQSAGRGLFIRPSSIPILTS